MKKIILTFLLALATLTAKPQFLFRISGNGLKPSYILGTIHTLHGSVLDYTPEYTEAEAKCEQFYTEYDVTDPQRMKELNDAIEQTKVSLQLPDGKTILDILSKERLELVNVRVKDVFGQNLSDSTMIALWNFQPIVFTYFITNKMKSEAKKHGPKSSSRSAFIDPTCILRAKMRGWEVEQLDDLEDRLKVQGFQQQSIDEQLDSLMALVSNYDQRMQSAINEFEVLKQSTTYWCLADFKKFEAMNYWKKTITNRPAVFKDRNVKWVPKMQEAMKKAPTMFVFGAGHLIGESGIIQLLSNAGYKIEQVKVK